MWLKYFGTLDERYYLWVTFPVPLKNLTIIGLLLFSGLHILGQNQDFFEEENWRKFRHHYEFGIGTTNFLGDLGGKDAVGTNDLRDLEWSQFHLALLAGYRYQFAKPFLLRLDAAYGKVTGDDKLTKEPFRQNRNINFKSEIFEVDLMVEWKIRLGGKKGHQYQMKRMNKESGPWRYRGSYLSLFAGVGLFHFNPKTELNGEWIELRPLRTEGQGLPDGPKEYKLWQINIPVGISWMVKMHKQWSFGFDVTHRYTFTDYVDDVSNVYYNPYDLELYTDYENPALAAYLSNPSLGLANGGLSDIVTAPGQQRGDIKDNDGYFYVLFKVDYLVMKKHGFDTKRTRGHGNYRKFKKVRPMTF